MDTKRTSESDHSLIKKVQKCYWLNYIYQILYTPKHEKYFLSFFNTLAGGIWSHKYSKCATDQY